LIFSILIFSRLRLQDYGAATALPIPEGKFCEKCSLQTPGTSCPLPFGAGEEQALPRILLWLLFAETQFLVEKQLILRSCFGVSQQYR
jgi:hypothetical protein